MKSPSAFSPGLLKQNYYYYLQKNKLFREILFNLFSQRYILVKIFKIIYFNRLKQNDRSCTHDPDMTEPLRHFFVSFFWHILVYHYLILPKKIVC